MVFHVHDRPSVARAKAMFEHKKVIRFLQRASISHSQDIVRRAGPSFYILQLKRKAFNIQLQ